MGGTFKIPDLNPDAPDIWVENIRDALFTSGMSAVFLAADNRVKLDVPVRLRNQVDVIPQWKLAYAWTVPRPESPQPTCEDTAVQVRGC